MLRVQNIVFLMLQLREKTYATCAKHCFLCVKEMVTYVSDIIMIKGCLCQFLYLNLKPDKTNVRFDVRIDFSLAIMSEHIITTPPPSPQNKTNPCEDFFFDCRPVIVRMHTKRMSF